MTGDIRESRHDPRVGGVHRLRSQRPPTFDLGAFGDALVRRDLAYQLAQYAIDADIRVVDPDHPPTAPRILRGTLAIHSWLHQIDALDLDVEVTHLVDGGDRFAFNQRWRDVSGASVVAVSTAELQDALITTQHTIVTWIRTWD